MHQNIPGFQAKVTACAKVGRRVLVGETERRAEGSRSRWIRIHRSLMGWGLGGHGK